MRSVLFGVAAVAAFGMSLAVAQAQAVPETTPPSTTAAPAAAPTDTAVAPSPTAADPDKIICRDLPPPTGSRLGGRRICAPKSAWDQRAREDQDAISRGQDRGSRGGGSSL
ncbi:MAG: hypothetical protein JSR60_12645 [Proteobacteria bacterium]|nr:hypothetical protein [Pseudomonadota bacterium]